MILGRANMPAAEAATAGAAMTQANESSTHRVSIGRKCSSMAQTSFLIVRSNEQQQAMCQSSQELDEVAAHSGDATRKLELEQGGAHRARGQAATPHDIVERRGRGAEDSKNALQGGRFGIAALRIGRFGCLALEWRLDRRDGP
jgi:hypothetical protein